MLKEKTKHGIDVLQMMAEFLLIIHEEKFENYDNHIKNFELLISKQIKRELTPQEKLDIYHGILNFINSESASNERIIAIEYLFEAKFISDSETTKKE
jgi:hypothetical protein